MLYDIVTVGHICLDSIYLPRRQKAVTVLGGPATYASLAAGRLGSRVAIVSKVGSDFPEAYNWLFEKERIDLCGLSRLGETLTTRFELRYTEDLSERHLQLKAKAPAITVEELPSPLRAYAIHLAPIAGEVTYEIAQHLRQCTDVLSLDPQGLVRSFSGDGRVSHVQLADKSILDLIDVYKSSWKELEAVTGVSDIDSAIKRIHDHGAKIVVVTLGNKGTILSTDEGVTKVPACTPARVVDPTGAGDVFIGGFLSEYVDGMSVSRCVCVGSSAASFAVEAVGPLSVGEKTQVYERARDLYEKEMGDYP